MSHLTLSTTPAPTPERASVTYPIDMGGWRVLRRYDEHWREVKEGDELTARRSYEGHSKRSGGDMVCLVRPSGKVEESSIGGAACS